MLVPHIEQPPKIRPTICVHKEKKGNGHMKQKTWWWKDHTMDQRDLFQSSRPTREAI